MYLRFCVYIIYIYILYFGKHDRGYRRACAAGYMLAKASSLILGSLGPGALFSLRVRGHERFFFLGPIIKKPHLQVLLEGYPSGDSQQISILAPEVNRMPFDCLMEKCFFVLTSVQMLK